MPDLQNHQFYTFNFIKFQADGREASVNITTSEAQKLHVPCHSILNFNSLGPTNTSISHALPAVQIDK